MLCIRQERSEGLVVEEYRARRVCNTTPVNMGGGYGQREIITGRTGKKEGAMVEFWIRKEERGR